MTSTPSNYSRPWILKKPILKKIEDHINRQLPDLLWCHQPCQKYTKDSATQLELEVMGYSYCRLATLPVWLLEWERHFFWADLWDIVACCWKGPSHLVHVSSHYLTISAMLHPYSLLFDSYHQFAGRAGPCDWILWQSEPMFFLWEGTNIQWYKWQVPSFPLLSPQMENWWLWVPGNGFD